MVKTGLEFEQKLCAKLNEYGCFIIKSKSLDHDFKLDFLLIRFPTSPTYVSLGVQVTCRVNAAEKVQEFLDLHKRVQVADQVVYLEFDNVDLDQGGALSTLAVLLDVKLNQPYRRRRVLGARILPNNQFGVFQLENYIAQLRESKIDQVYSLQTQNNGSSPSQEIEGHIETFHRGKGEGKIRVANNGHFHFQIGEVVDQALLIQLKSLPIVNATTKLNPPIRVNFTDGGFTKDQKPEAKYIHPCVHC